MDFNNCPRTTIANCNQFAKAQTSAIIFWDTCGLLDIYRDCINLSGGNHIELLKRISEKTINGEIINFSSDLLEVEFNDNLHEAKQVLQRKIDDIVISYNSISTISKTLTPANVARNLNANDAELNILNNLDLLVQNFINQIILIDRADFIVAAEQRHIQKMAPGHNGFKDCIFWLQAIDLRGQLGLPLIPFKFITNNIKDYYSNGNVHPTIQPELITYNIQILRKVITLYPHV